MNRSGRIEPLAGLNQGAGGPGRPSWDRLEGWVAAVLAVVTVWAFLPVLGNGFVEHWDDRPTSFRTGPFVDWAGRSFAGRGRPRC
jgi:hypothetical protein